MTKRIQNTKKQNLKKISQSKKKLKKYKNNDQKNTKYEKTEIMVSNK